MLKKYYLSYTKYLKEKLRINNCVTIDDYLSFFEENTFLDNEIKFKLLHAVK
jgi:hypothetical protein